MSEFKKNNLKKIIKEFCGRKFMKNLFDGGSFDEQNGKASSIVAKMVATITNVLPDAEIKTANGGNYNELNKLLNSTPNYAINMKGHGSIIMASTVDGLLDTPTAYAVGFLSEGSR